jgi:hypothetical protein
MKFSHRIFQLVAASLTLIFTSGILIFAAQHVARPEPLVPAIIPNPSFAAPWLTFNTAVSANNGSPVALARGDFDGDGAVDVVAAQNYARGGFTFMRNEGAGRLAQPVNFSGATRTSGIVAADFNNDGKLDVATSDSDAVQFGNTVSVWLGNGSGTFGARQLFSLGSGNAAVPVGIAAADFDGDGAIDIAVTAYGQAGSGNSVRILHNNGNGTFAAAVSIPAGMGPYDIAAGDLNGDGRPDLVVANNEYSVNVLVNNGSGGFNTAIPYGNLTSDNWAGPLLACVTLGDVDGDGKLDVLYGNTRTWDGFTGRVVQLRNNGSGGLTRASDIPLVTYTAGPADLALADLNGDGKLDILAAEYDQRATDGVCVMMNNGAGNFGPATLYSAGQSTIAVLAADMNGDSKPDIVTADDYSNAVTVRLNPGNGNFTTIPFDRAGSFQFFQDAADIDGDRDIDIFTSGPHPSADEGAIMRNNGSGRFTRTAINNGQDGVAAGVLRDLNGDGYPDLLFNNANTAQHYDFFTAINDGHGIFGPITRWLVGSAGWGAIDAFDIDNDGDLDVIDCEAEGAPGIPNRFFIAINNGNGTFQQPYAYDLLPRRPDSVAAGDFNGDGKLDLAFANTGAYGFDSGVFVVLGNGNGTFQSPLEYIVGRGPAYIMKGDFDRDGKLDLATLNSGYNDDGNETVTLLFGVGNGTFGRITTTYAPYSPDLLGATGMVVADIDSDGDLDLLTAGVSNDLAVYLNNGSGNFAFPYRVGVIGGAHAPLYRDFNGDGIPDIAVLNSPPPAGFDGGVAVLAGVPLAPVAQSVFSRKMHGSAGVFDLALPLTGTPGMEPRSGGATHDYQVVVNFGSAISVNGNPQAQVTSGAGVIGSNGASNGGMVTVNGSSVTVPLTNVADAQTINVTISGVTNSSGSTNVVIPMRILIGDASTNGSVNASDVALAKSQVGQAIGSTNFKADVNLSGTINASDISLIKSKVGTSAP